MQQAHSQNFVEEAAQGQEKEWIIGGIMEGRREEAYDWVMGGGKAGGISEQMAWQYCTWINLSANAALSYNTARKGRKKERKGQREERKGWKYGQKEQGKRKETMNEQKGVENHRHTWKEEKGNIIKSWVGKK